MAWSIRSVRVVGRAGIGEYELAAHLGTGVREPDGVGDYVQRVLVHVDVTPLPDRDVAALVNLQTRRVYAAKDD